MNPPILDRETAPTILAGILWHPFTSSGIVAMYRLLGCAALFCIMGVACADAQTYNVLLSFTGTGGVFPGGGPEGSLTVNGTTMYGITQGGGTYGDGNIFSVGTNGTGFQNLLSLTGTGGAYPGIDPYGSLTLGGTTLYVMTNGGGTYGKGTIFSVGTNGTGYHSIASFSGTGGTCPGESVYDSLTLNGSTLYGMTAYGGTSGCGTVFSVGTNGNFKSLVSFTGTGGSYTGWNGQGNVTLSGTTLYGMTINGGADEDGNVFSIGTDGTGFKNLLTFSGTNGTNPVRSLMLDGTTLYGMTSAGGIYGDGNIFSINTDGTGFHNLVSFSGTDGNDPFGDLTLIGSTLYGMTQIGGTYGKGNIFSVNTDGSGLQTLLSFNGTNGEYPIGDLSLNGSTLYGMASGGGANGDGVIFSLSVPEPSTLTLLGVGAIGFLAFCWRKWRVR